MKNYSALLKIFLSFSCYLHGMEYDNNSINSSKMTSEEKKVARDALLIKLGELLLIGLPQVAQAIADACLNDKEIPDEIRPALFSKELVALGQENPDESLRTLIKMHHAEETKKHKNFITYYEQKKQETKKENSPDALRMQGLELSATLSRMRFRGRKEAAEAFEKACRENKPITDEKILKQLREFKLLGEAEKKPGSNNAAAIKNNPPKKINPSKSPTPFVRKK